MRNLREPSKRHNTIREMGRLNIAILGISKIRLPGSGKCRVNNDAVYYLGGDGKHHLNGVAFNICEELRKYIRSVCNVSDRVIIKHISSKPVDINLDQPYEKTAVSYEEELEKFYNDVKSVTDSLNRKDFTIVMGNLKAKVG